MNTDLEPEYPTVGGLLLAPHSMGEVERWLRPGDFARPAARLTYELMLGMHARDYPIDPVLMLAEMRHRGVLRRDGYPANELVRMTSAVIVPASTVYYARLVLAQSIARVTQEIGTRLVQIGSRPRDPAELLEMVGEQVRAFDDARRRWATATSTPRPAQEQAQPREPVRLSQAIAELELTGPTRTLAS